MRESGTGRGRKEGKEGATNFKSSSSQVRENYSKFCIKTQNEEQEDKGAESSDQGYTEGSTSGLRAEQRLKVMNSGDTIFSALRFLRGI